MNKKIEELTIEGITYVPKDSINQKVIELNGEESLWMIGKNYLIRTVTMIQIGKLIKVTEKELLLENACWVADTGRFNEALSKGSLNEVELFNMPVMVGRGTVIDATEWIHDLPKINK
jgi:hypothetical protein